MQLDIVEATSGALAAPPSRAEVRISTYRRVKPMVDFVLALGLVLAFLPILVAIAIAIKLESPGPAFFIQRRLGENRRSFRMFKFRSMYQDAELRLDELRVLSDVDGPVFKMRADPRVTRVGRFLRRTSLDELPQLLNVLLGEMSLVGPRPPLPAEVEKYRESDLFRLTVKPGLTCLWQISGRSDCSFNQWMALDRAYVLGMTARLDLYILVRTVGVVLSGRGAY